MTTPIVTIDATGPSVPSYADCYSYFADGMKGIYGDDLYIDPDSQDGQFIGIGAAAVNDMNAALVLAYNQFSPATSIGTGLSSVVKINGIARLVPSRSTCDVTVGGQVGTIITNGQIGDNENAGQIWTLPASVTIPDEGQITVTATCSVDGAVTALIGTLTEILTPTRGWQTVTNTVAATAGAPVESDPTLRARQTQSTNLPAQTPASSMAGQIANLFGVKRVKIYDNDTGATDANGIPGHTLAVVVDGGDATQIIEAIQLKKNEGTGTLGSVCQIVTDDKGAPMRICFFPLTNVPITVTISVTALPGYISTTGTQLVQDVVDWINSLAIGEEIYRSKLWGPAGLNNTPLGDTYNVTSIKIARDSDPVGLSDIVIAFNEAALCGTGNVTLTVT